MKRYFSNLVLPLLTMALISCSKPEIPKGFIKFEMKTMQKAEGDSILKIKGFAQVKLAYPDITEATNNGILTILRNYVNNQILLALFKEGRYKQPEFLIENFLAEYKKFKDRDPSAAQYWFLERTVDISLSTDRIASFRFYESSFLGGAHPNTNAYYTNYDLGTGGKLELKDLFIEGYENKLNTLVEKKFREVRGLKPDENLNEAGYQFADNKFRVNNNLGFTNEGIVLFYNAYEVAPYYMGSTKVNITYRELEGLLKKEFLPVQK